jgi:hypothetical protein
MSRNCVCQSFILLSQLFMRKIERLKKTWRSAVYGFFKNKVVIGYEDGRKYHFFECAAIRCKGKGGVRRYQDSQDRAATLNLKTHAIKCFGADAVDAAFKKGPVTTPGASIFASFAQLGQRAVSFSHRAHTSDETRFVSLSL